METWVLEFPILETGSRQVAAATPSPPFNMISRMGVDTINQVIDLAEEMPFRMRDVLRALWFLLADERYKFVAWTLVLFAALTTDLLMPYLVGWMSNLLIEYAAHPSPKPSMVSFFFLVAGLGAIQCTFALIRLSSKRALARLSLDARYNAKVWGFERLLDFSLAWHQKESTGNKAQRVLTGAESVREWVHEMTANIFPGLVGFVGSLIACVFVHPAFIIFFFYYLGILFSTEIYFDRKINKMSDQLNKSMENASGSFVEGASNILAVKAMGAAACMTQTVAEREELSRQFAYKRLKYSNTKWMCFQIHNGISMAMYLSAIGWMVFSGAMAAGFFVTYAMYFEKMRESATNFTDKLQQMIERKANLGRMMSLFWGGAILPKGKEAFPTMWQHIKIGNARFRYGEQPTIGPLNLEIARGEIVGIAGHSGSGKSTLIKLLLGLYHLESGSLSIGDTPIADIRHEALTSNVSVVLQETELFNFSLHDNITMMRTIEPQRLARAIVVAGLGELSARLPEGLNTIIGERGYALSGGERQRVGIARAICRDATVLLLDEATSALDSKTEQLVMRALLQTRAAQQTILIVAHRISTLREADRILIFEQGRIVEEGGFEALAHNGSTRFGELYAIQQA